MTKQHPLKISTFLLLSQFFISIIGVGSVACFALYSIYYSGQQELIRYAENLAYSISNGLEAPLGEETRNLLSITPENQTLIKGVVHSYLVSHPNTQYALYQTSGRLLVSSQPALFADLSGENRPPEIHAALALTRGSSVRPDANGQLMLYAAATIDHGSQVFGVIQLALPFHLAMAPTYRVMTCLGLIAAVIVILMLLVSWRGSAYLSKPVIHVSQVAEQLSQGDLAARARLAGPREVVQLAQTLNTMAGRLHNNLESMQSFVANASHELRTPLTSIKLLVGALRAGAVEEPEVAARFLNQMDCEIDRLVYTVNEMLDLSQIEGSSQAGAYHPVDLLDLACEVQAFWEARSQQAGLKLTLQHDSHLPLVKGDAYRLRRLFDNLIDNAIKNTASGGSVQILLRRCMQPTWVRLEIRDNGTGIEPQHLPHIFERFYRVNPAPQPADSSCADSTSRRSSGSGLGLAIARSIVLAHNGQIGVESSQGCGSIFWAELPTWTN